MLQVLFHSIIKEENMSNEDLRKSAEVLAILLTSNPDRLLKNQPFVIGKEDNITVYGIIYAFAPHHMHLALYTSFPEGIRIRDNENERMVHGGVTFGLCYEEDHFCEFNGDTHERFPEMGHVIGCDYAHCGDEFGESYTPNNIYSSINGLINISKNAFRETVPMLN